MRSGSARLAAAVALAVASPACAAADGWWREFHDPLVDAAVDSALAGNFDLAAAAARVEQARAIDKRARAALLPDASAGGSAAADSISRETAFGEASRKLGFPRGYQLYQAGVETRWEIDLFGGLSARRRAAVAQAGATRAQADAVRLAVIAQTADACLRLRGLQVQLVLAQQQARVAADLATLIRRRSGQGLSSDLDAGRAEAASAAAAAALPPLHAAIARELDRIGVLAGGNLAWRAQALVPGPIPVALQPALDADAARLMRRRPDLAAAEQQVAAAHAGVAVARAEYYPHVSFGGLIGVASLGTTSIVSGNAVDAQASAAIRWRLFDFGRVDAEVAAARGREKETLAQWRQAALGASAEVADAIAALDEGHREAAQLERQVALLTRTRSQAQAAYAQGVVSQIEVLAADQALIEAQDRLAGARAALARASVAAVRAIGGGYGEQGADHG
jgi:NodT family efflux transporter outer membrane factor (OMF) lipoprotein